MREPRPRTHRMPILEPRYLVLAPAMEAVTAGPVLLDANSRVAVDHVDIDGIAQQHAQHLEQVVGGVRRVGLVTD